MDSIAPATMPRYLQDILGTGTPSTAKTLPNLSAIADNTDGTATPRQIAVATGQRIAREFTGYGHLAAQANVTGNTTPYLNAYVKFYDSLSPAEQQSPRYAGTRDAAVKGLAANGSTNTSNSTTPSAATPSTPAELSAQAFGIIAAQNQSSFSSNDTLSGNGTLPTPDLLTSLRSLLGVIDAEQHPPAPKIPPIPPGALDLTA